MLVTGAHVSAGAEACGWGVSFAAARCLLLTFARFDGWVPATSAGMTPEGERGWRQNADAGFDAGGGVRAVVWSPLENIICCRADGCEGRGFCWRAMVDFLVGGLLQGAARRLVPRHPAACPWQRFRLRGLRGWSETSVDEDADDQSLAQSVSKY